MSIGDPLQAEIGPDRFPLIGTPTVSARDAAANVLRAYLERIVFATAAGDGKPSKRWRLNEVRDSWPGPRDKLRYPAASIDDAMVVEEEHSLVPTVIEDSCDCYGAGTVLWKTAELSIEFQVDFWLNTEADRRAVDAGLPRIFSPTEGRSGVMLAGDPDYFDRSVRATLLSRERVNTSDAVYAHERRLRAGIRCDVAVVHLRGATVLQPQHILEVTDNS